MLAHFSPEDSTDGDKELIKVRNSWNEAQLTFWNNCVYFCGIYWPFLKHSYSSAHQAYTVPDQCEVIDYCWISPCGKKLKHPHSETNQSFIRLQVYSKYVLEELNLIS